MNQKLQRETVDFVQGIIHKYYCDNDAGYVIDRLSADAVRIGMGEGDEAYTFGSAAEFFRKSCEIIPRCTIEEEKYSVTELENGSCVCASVYIIVSGRSMSYRRTSFVLRQSAKGLECVHIHSSVPCRGKMEKGVFPDKCFMHLKAYDELAQKNHQINVILNAVKGGLKISRDDETYSYLYVGDELCSMFGYTREEYMEVTGGSAVGAVYPPDLPKVMQECKAAFKNGSRVYAIKYRIPCKDGSLKWIIDSGKKVTNEAGETIINSIYLDVTDIEGANEEISKQKKLLDSIYDSVMCGILRYTIKDGAFEYITMNREAIRMLGYSSESQCFDLGPKVFYERIYHEDRAVVRAKISALSKPGDRFSYEYRIQKPDCSILWVYGTTELILDSDKKLVIQMVMMDITERKKLELALEQERQRFRIAIESTPAVIFEYDIVKDTYNAYGTLEEGPDKHAADFMLKSFLENEMDSLVAEDYRKSFRDILRSRSVNEMELMMALYPGSSEFVWARINVTPFFDDGGNPVKIIGKIRNIRSEKEKEFALEAAKSRDGLTGLYTRETGTRMAKEYMASKSPEQICGIMLLDMDDFKRINKEEGSVFADALLQEVAVILRKETGKDDIQIRLGGDEFMLFIKNCNKARATVLGPRIARRVSGIFSSGSRDLNVSVSIGMCVTEVVDEYSGLYRCAESTLKYVKENARGQAACYLDTSNELGTMLTQIYPDAHFINEIIRPTERREEDLTSFALELLGKAKSLDDAIFLLLSRIGKSYGFDRVSILEADNDYLSFRFSYQWAENHADLQMDKNFYFSGEELEAVNRMFNEEGLSYGNLGDKVSGMASCLHAGTWNHGLYFGSLSFEIRREGYVWTEEQHKLIKEMAKIIFSFIMKARADAVSQAKTDFLSRMSHEIRTPMNAIAGMTTIAKTVLDDKEKATECLRKIESANTYLMSLINDILDMSRIESGKVEINCENIHIGRFIEKLESLMKPQADTRGIGFTIENLCPPECCVLADALRLNQVLVNIIGNAVKFTDEGGLVVVKIEPAGDKNGSLLVKFSVRDTGIGISSEAAGRIFNAFEQAGKDTSARYGGTGLGLSISSRLVQMMGGVLEVESEPGKGSEFFFTLPFASGSGSGEAAEKTLKAGVYDFAGKKILLAEDNELNREIAETLLKINGFQVESASDGREALEMFLNARPGHADAILMDIRMPVMDGLEATKRVRTSGIQGARDIPIIAMTANAFDKDMKKSMESGMDGHISKPFEIEKLLSVLMDCMRNPAYKKFS